MPTTLTVQNIPDQVYARLKLSAALHRRSLHAEAIFGLEQILLPPRRPASDSLARARALRLAIATSQCSSQDLDLFKREGRA